MRFAGLPVEIKEKQQTRMAVKNLDTTKFEYFCSRVAAGIGVLILGCLSLYSIFYTRSFPTNHDEMPLEGPGFPIWTVIFMAAALFVLFYAVKGILKCEKHRKRNVTVLLVFTCAYAAIYGILWAKACKYYMMWDPQLVSFWANQLANGMNDVSASDIDYLTSYPHQIGLIALMEQIYRWFGWENYHAFQALNAVGAGATVYLGYRIIRLITERLEPAVYFLLLMLCCHPFYIYVSYVYGEVLSVVLSLLAIYALLFYLRERKKRFIILMAIALTFACLVRSNCYIVVAAVGCVLIVKMVSEKTLRHGIAFVVCLGLFLVSHTMLLRVYEERLNISLDEGMPTILWVAMGLQEGGSDGLEREAGWYNGFAWDVFVDETNRDQQLSKERASEAISESAEKFLKEPSYAFDFFRRKISSQWNEPTYACLQETNRRREERPALLDRLYKGDLWKPFVRVMDVYQSLVYMGALFYLLFMIRKKIPVESLSLFIIMIGGFLFYVFWEAKSRYILPYFMALIPMAACGWDFFLQKLAAWKNSCRKAWKVKHPQEEKGDGTASWRFLTEKFEPVSGKIILVLSGLPCIFLFFYSLFFTTVYESNDLEVPSQAADVMPLMLLFVLAGLLVLYGAGRLILKREESRRRNLNLLLAAVLLHCAVFCTAWNLFAQSALRADPLYIHVIAGGFATGDVSAGGMDYLFTYPHQAGQALLLELVYRIFGYENLMAFRSLNTLGVLLFVVSGYGITWQLFQRDETKVNFLLLCAGCIPLLIYTNVIYGEVLAIAATAFGIWMFLFWMKQKKLWQFVLMTLAFVFGVYMKNNVLIAAVAVSIVIVIRAVEKGRKKLAFFVLPFLAVLLLAQPAMTKLYEYRSGWPLDCGMPKNLWVAMGLQGEGMTSGWWNEFPDRIYKEEAGYDPVQAKKLGAAAIGLSLQEFGRHPLSAARFLEQKFVSQWNDASYGCQVSAGSQDTPVLEAWMNGYQSLVFFGASAFAVLGVWRKKEEGQSASLELLPCLPMLILLGGFLFHTAWEVKGRYGLFYFVLLLPAAAEGISKGTERLGGFLKTNRKRQEKKEKHEAS